MILDTNCLSAFIDGLEEIRPFVEGERIALPAIVLGEYRFGIAQSNRRGGYEEWLVTYLPGMQILAVEEQTAQHYADIRLELKRAGTPIPVNDLWIAALCRQHRLPILSRDRHFDDVKGIRRISW